MSKFMKAQFIGLFLVSFTLSNCDISRNKNKVKDPNNAFYSDLGGLDRPRIPLIKPYELLKVSRNEWLLELQNPDLLTLAINNIKGVQIHDSLIAIYSEGGTEFQNKLYEKAWFVIEPRVGLEKAFVTEKSFNDFYNKLKHEGKVQFFSPDSLYKSFEVQKRIDWR